MLILGHLALGYLSGVLISKFSKEKIFIPLIWFVALAPDLDVLIPFIVHRGPTHSIIMAIMIFLPIFLVYKRGYIYFAALISHSLIGDYFTAYGCKLFWPILSEWFVAPSYLVMDYQTQNLVEILLFLIMLVAMGYNILDNK